MVEITLYLENKDVALYYSALKPTAFYYKLVLNGVWDMNSTIPWFIGAKDAGRKLTKRFISFSIF